MKKYLGWSLALLMTACATTKQANVQVSQSSSEGVIQAELKQEPRPPQAFSKNVEYVQKLTNWKISGAIAAKVKQEGWQARLLWSESSPQVFSGRLYAYFSPEQVVIKGKPGKVILFNEKGQEFSDSSIEKMIKKSTGWQIPMDNMRYWIRGIYAPNKAYQASYDRESRIKTLTQSGWTITYKDYLHISGYVLPKKIEIVKGDLRLRLVISKWTF